MSAMDHRHFSLREEARSTGQHTDAFLPGKKLRGLPVAFVSAGLLQGTIPKKDHGQVMIANTLRSDEPSSPLNTKAMASLEIRSPSPVSSIGSEDEIVFRGRGSAKNPIPKPVSVENTTKEDPGVSAPANHLATPVQEQPTTYSVEHSESETQTIITEPIEAGHVQQHVSDKTPNLVSEASGTLSDTDSVIPDVFEKRLGGKTRWEAGATPWESRSKPGIGWLRPGDGTYHPQVGDTAALDDYMNNIRDNASDNEPQAPTCKAFARRDLDLHSENGLFPDGGDDSLYTKAPKSHQDDWDSDMIADLDVLSTSSDVMDEVEQILARRARPNGIQYLVLYANSTLDDSHWLPSTFLRKSHELQLIEDFELERIERKALYGADDSTDDDVLEEMDNSATYAQAMQYEDEQLARLLGKQEEFGMRSDDLKLFGDNILPGPAGVRSKNLFISYPRTSKYKRQSKASKRAFPSASAMADALDQDPYGGFDIMDTERPSLKPKKKGRRGQKPPELSDSDLNDQLQASWEYDRQKKRLKKAEREELRKQGLLGRKDKSTPDIGVKYKGGFSIVDIIEEIRTFWLSDLSSFSLPPMEAHRRACIHQFVHNLGMSSTSRGEGSNRFTVVSKTRRTQAYDAFLFDKLASEKKYRFRFNTANSHVKKNGPKIRHTVGYKDGDTVGASAPELGPENKGRAMLEKMGWTKGTALGAIDNKGIMQPIAHVVKTNKAGLK